MIAEKSNLSPFLEPDSVLALVAKRGPVIKFDLVKSLAATFGRACPDQKTITKTLNIAKLERFRGQLIHGYRRE